MLKDRRGDTAVEWLVIAVIAVGVLGTAAYAIASNASARGIALSEWIAALYVPASP